MTWRDMTWHMILYTDLAVIDVSLCLIRPNREYSWEAAQKCTLKSQLRLLSVFCFSLFGSIHIDSQQRIHQTDDCSNLTILCTKNVFSLNTLNISLEIYQRAIQVLTAVIVTLHCPRYAPLFLYAWQYTHAWEWVCSGVVMDDGMSSIVERNRMWSGRSKKD